MHIQKAFLNSHSKSMCSLVSKGWVRSCIWLQVTETQEHRDLKPNWGFIFSHVITSVVGRFRQIWSSSVSLGIQVFVLHSLLLTCALMFSRWLPKSHHYSIAAKKGKVKGQNDANHLTQSPEWLLFIFPWPEPRHISIASCKGGGQCSL